MVALKTCLWVSAKKLCYMLEEEEEDRLKSPNKREGTAGLSERMFIPGKLLVQ